MVEPGHVYAHHRGGRYLVLHLCTECTKDRRGRTGVVYASLTSGEIRHRDHEEFVEPVMWPDGLTRPRYIRSS
jgi:hypothetical protein